MDVVLSMLIHHFFIGRVGGENVLASRRIYMLFLANGASGRPRRVAKALEFHFKETDRVFIGTNRVARLFLSCTC